MLIDDIRSGESPVLEFKRAIPNDVLKYLKTVSAFANGAGGRIIFGVDADLSIIGMDEPFVARDKIADAIANGIEPTIVPDISFQTIEDKTLIVVEIAQEPRCPYWVKSLGREHGTFIRYDATTRAADSAILTELSYDGCDRGFDVAHCRSLEITSRMISSLCRRMRSKALEACETVAQRKSVHPVTNEKLEEWGVLTRRNGRLVATNAFALLSGNKALTTTVRCGVFRGLEHQKMLDRREYGGPIQDQINFAYEWVLSKINMAAVVKGVYRHDVYELPEDALRELITNAVMHRSYSAWESDIQIALYDDRLEIISPGGLPRGVTVERMKIGCSRCRNKAIAEAFAYMRVAEKWGLGVPNVMHDFADYGLSEPEYVDWGNAVKVIVWRAKKLAFDGKKLAFDGKKLVFDGKKLVFDGKKLVFEGCSVPTQKRITLLYAKFASRKVFRRSDIIRELEMTRTTAANVISVMLKHGLIEHVVGYGKGAYRIITGG